MNKDISEFDDEFEMIDINKNDTINDNVEQKSEETKINSLKINVDDESCEKIIEVINDSVKIRETTDFSGRLDDIGIFITNYKSQEEPDPTTLAQIEYDIIVLQNDLMQNNITYEHKYCHRCSYYLKFVFQTYSKYEISKYSKIAKTNLFAQFMITKCTMSNLSKKMYVSTTLKIMKDLADKNIARACSQYWISSKDETYLIKAAELYHLDAMIIYFKKLYKINIYNSLEIYKKMLIYCGNVSCDISEYLSETYISLCNFYIGKMNNIKIDHVIEKIQSLINDQNSSQNDYISIYKLLNKYVEFHNLDIEKILINPEDHAFYELVKNDLIIQ